MTHLYEILKYNYAFKILKNLIAAVNHFTFLEQISNALISETLPHNKKCYTKC